MIPLSDTAGLNFLVFPDLGSWLRWERTCIPNRPTHLMRALQKRHEVGRILVVEPPYPLLRSWLQPQKHRLQGGSAKPVWNYLGAAAWQVEEKITVLELPAVPLSRSNAIRELTWSLSLWLTRRAIEATSLRPFVLLFGVPYNHRLIGVLDEALSVFDESGANWLSFFKGGKHQRAEIGYRAIREKADVILLATEYMRDILGKGRNAIYLLPDAVDYRTFQDEPVPVPPDLEALPRPRLGYMGTLDQRMDLAILQALASAFPAGSIVLIGPMLEPRAYFDPLRQKSNIRFLGPRPYMDVPRYVAGFDACLIPHQLTDMTLSQSSMKFYEYLASGKPIVSTPVPPAPEFTEFAYVVNSPHAFVEAARRALSEENQASARARMERSRQESWDHRADALLRIVARHLPAGRSTPRQGPRSDRLLTP